MAILFKHARVLAMVAGARELTVADVLVDGPVIRAVGQDVPAPDEHTWVIDARGHLLMPGLVNGHLHSPGALMKGAITDRPLELFMLYEIPPLMSAPESARLYYLRTLLSAVEMLKHGVTAVHDDAFFVPVPTPETIGAVMRAYRDVGMRATVTLDQPNVVEYDKHPFLEELLPPAERAAMQAAPRQSMEELLALYDGFIESWHGAAEGRLRCAVSCSAPQRVTPAYLEALTDLARAHDLPFDIHILETRLQRVLGQVKYGKSLIRYVHDLGLLDERKMVIHAIWIDRTDIELMAAAGCTIAHNPVSNLKIGSGVMPWRELHEAGIPICLGSDEAAVDDTANMWGVAKMAGLIHKIAEPDWRRWPTAPEILDCLIGGGARALRLDQRIGKVAPGYEADLILVDLDTIAFTPLNDLERQLVFCENGSSVALVLVQGKVVAQRGRVLGVDEAELRAEVRAIMAEYRGTLEAARRNAERLGPYYEAMYQRSLAEHAPMLRWVPPFGRTG